MELPDLTEEQRAFVLDYIHTHTHSPTIESYCNNIVEKELKIILSNFRPKKTYENVQDTVLTDEHKETILQFINDHIEDMFQGEYVDLDDAKTWVEIYNTETKRVKRWLKSNHTVKSFSTQMPNIQLAVFEEESIECCMDMLIDVLGLLDE